MEVKHLPRIINFLSETDYYKDTMGQALLHQHSKKITTWSLKVRNGKKFTKEMYDEICWQVDEYCKLRYTEEELQFLRITSRCPGGGSYFKEDYLQFLYFWHPVRNQINITLDDDGTLHIECTGPAAHVSRYETQLMAIICEVFNRMGGEGIPYEKLFEMYKAQVEDIIDRLKSGIYDIGVWSDFGFRRRLSGEAQEWALTRLKEEDLDKKGFIGTSNTYLAMKLGFKAIGTMAHEFCMLVGQGYPERNPAYSNKYMLDSWIQEYGTLNGIALTDTIGTPAFLKDFTLTYAKTFDGVRHDSADPYWWGDMMIEHYKSYGIDPMTKTLLFSDSLSFEKATAIKKYFAGKAKVAFGIGGSFCSLKDHAMNCVIKITEVDGQPVAKLSDCEGKNMCKDPEYIDYLKKSVDWRLSH